MAKRQGQKKAKFVVLNGAIGETSGAYHKRADFATLAEATACALRNSPARLLMRAPFPKDSTAAPCCLVVEHYGKHDRSTGGGETENAKSYELSVHERLASAMRAANSAVSEDTFEHAEVCLELKLS